MNAMKRPTSKGQAAESEMLRKIGTNLRSARRMQDITQKELSQHTGVIQANISLLENGRGNPTLRTILRLAEALDLQIEFIFTPEK
jgi:transcriptional regulator with XRE-family HTH domain